MASGSRDSPTFEEEELKGDGKKRKFKPFEAVRKFFGKNKRKSKDEQVSVVAVKAKSTTALHNDEDDDGGFKGHQPRPLGGNRSISEDSVFSPEQRETNLTALKKTAVSEESIPQSAFQAELFSKLNKRRSQYSDDDDGLPHSPTPPVTTADIIMGGPLKPLPAGGKSTSRESDKSLISMDGSENEEDDPFQSKWKSSVPSKVSRLDKSPGSEGPIDFDKMTGTELLKSDAAKDKISVKPRARKATRKSQKKRDGSSPHSLPSLNEESPTKSQTEEPAPSPKKAVAPQDSVVLEVSVSSDKQEQPQVALVEKGDSTSSQQHQKAGILDSSGASQKPKASPLATSPSKPFPAGASSARDEVKRSSLKSSTVTVPTESSSVNAKRASFEGSEVKVKETVVTTASDSKPATVPPSVTVASEITKKESFRDAAPVTLSSPSSSFKQKEQGDSSSSKTQQASSSLSQSSTTAVESSPSLKPHTSDTSSGTRTSAEAKVSSAASTQQGETVASARITISSSGSTAVEAAKSATSTKSSVSVSAVSPTEVRRDGLRPTDGQTAAYSPKDDYKLRRQSRSKTLPEQPISKDEQFATKVQRTASHRVEPSSSQNASPEVSPRLTFAGVGKGREGKEKEKTVEAATKNEPEWFALARKKTGRQEEKEEKSEATSTTPHVKETAEAKESLAISVTELTKSPSKSDSFTTAKSEPVSSVTESSDTVSAQSVSSAASKFEKPVEIKSAEVTRTPVRGGSVKTSPTKVNTAQPFANRGSSVKVSSTRSDFGSVQRKETPSTQPAAAVQTSVAPSATAASAKQEVKKEEPKSVESSPAKEVPKWKTQSMKTTAAAASATPSATPRSSRFGSVKTQSNSSSTTAAVPASTGAVKMEPKAAASPMKTAALNKTSSVEAKEEKEKTSVPAWRANLGQKKRESDIKIELIESNSSTPASVASGGPKKEDASKTQDSPSKTAAGNKEVQSDQCRGSATSRSSKVLDLVKNFQNLQVS